jgi:acyl-coenzyme A thioesterase PaaI-like protein
MNGKEIDWLDFLGATFETIGVGEATLSLRARHSHLNHNETVSGGVLLGAMELAAGAATMGPDPTVLEREFVVVRSADIEFLAPARSEEFTVLGRCVDLRVPTVDEPEVEVLALAEVRDGTKVACRARIGLCRRRRRRPAREDIGT